MSSISRALKELDFYRKVPKELTQGSVSGGIMTIITAAFMSLLIILEFEDTQIVMDSKHDEILRINVNITLPELSCLFASLDIVDSLGNEQFNVSRNLRKYKIDGKGWSQEVTQEAEEHPKYQELSVRPEESNIQYSTLLGSKNFQSFIESNKFTFVDFFAPWCHWCQKLAPVWEATAKAVASKGYGQHVKLARVDCTDPESKALCSSNHVQAYPTIILYRQKTHSHEFYAKDRSVDAFINYLETKIGKDTLEELSKTKKESDEQPTNTVGLDGCRIEGFLEVKRTPGNFHISAHSTSYTFDPTILNITHLIHQISFGDPLTNEQYNLLPSETQSYINTLHANFASQSEKQQTIQHYLKVVSTEYHKADGDIINAYQYTASSGEYTKKDDVTMPMALFNYDLSPMSVRITERRTPFFHFLTSLCAIIGGAFVILRAINNVVDDSVEKLKRKKEGLGKLG